MITVTHAGNHTTITVAGKFSFKDYREFRAAYQERPTGPTITYTIDLHGVDYIDSAALGMMVILRDHAGGDQASVAIKGAQGTVLEAIQISNYEQLFHVGP